MIIFFEVPPSPPFFGTADSKGVTGTVSVSAESKGLICSKIVQNSMVLGTAHSKGLRCENGSVGQQKSGRCLPLGVGLYVVEYNSFDS